MPSSSCECACTVDGAACGLLSCSRRPGDYLSHDVDEIEGFKARLHERLAPTGSLAAEHPDDPDWNIYGALIGRRAPARSSAID